MQGDKEQLLEGMGQLGFSLTDAQANSLVAYLDTLEETNKSFNLTRIPRDQYVTLHLLDSLTALLALDTTKSLSILDVGTGAGFPGVPLAAALPQCSVTILDSTGKKVRFASETAQACGISNLVGIHARAEDLAKQNDRYDIVVSRAVAAFPKLMEWLLPLVKPGGFALAMKGSGYEDELQGSDLILKKHNASIERTIETGLPLTDIKRYLIIVRKDARSGGR